MAAGAAGVLTGAKSLRRALRMLRRERGLWIWAALPMAINLLTFGIAIAFFLENWEGVAQAVSGFLSTSDPESWYEWLWIGPIRLFAWLVRWILLAVVGVAVYVLFTVVGGVIASPFLDVLSRKVEAIHVGRVLEEDSGLLQSSLRAVVEEAKRTFFFVAVQLGFVLLGIVPGLQPFAAVGAIAFTLLFLPLDYTGYTLDRRGVSFRERRKWVWRHRGLMAGFGAASFATFFVPGLNFLCLPWLVTAGTLLALDVGAPPGRLDSRQPLT